MQDRIFIDTNIWIYNFLNTSNSEDIKKADEINTLINNSTSISVSTQVLNEFSNVLLRKYKTDSQKIILFLNEIISISELYLLNKNSTFKALHLNEKYGISFYDALIVSVAIDAKCSILYSEDMHDGLFIDKRIKIVNPFNFYNKV